MIMEKKKNGWIRVMLKVALYKYVSRGGKVDGFYSGNTFANQLGISTQVPNKVEIVSNNMAAKVREVPI